MMGVETENNNELICSYLSTEMGRQRLAHTMVGSMEPFVFIPPKLGDYERGIARAYRLMAAREGMPSFAAKAYNDAANSWDEYAKLPACKKLLNNLIGIIFRR